MPLPDRNGQNDPLADRLLGSWTLVDYRTTSDDGRVHHPLGPHAQGLLIYSSDGFMSAQIMRTGRDAFRTRNVHSGDTEERAAAMAGYLAYSGSFTVDESTSRVDHNVEVSLFPNWIGSQQLRAARCDDTTLELSSDPLVFRTVTLRPTLTWRRA